MKKLIAGNWKMNGSASMAQELVSGIISAVDADVSMPERCDFLVCPPFPYVFGVQALCGGKPYLSVGSQDCSAEEEGAYTGEVSASMLKDSGASHVILGHSERRQYHGEGDALIARKAAQAHAQGLISIICVGETEGQRESGAAESVVAAQLMGSLPDGTTFENTVIAYEPVWAIGTGRTATPEDAAAMHEFIREKLKEQLEDSEKVRILYGGSMKPDNAAELLAAPNIDGGLIGGASLQADNFVAIAKAVSKR